MHKVLLTWEFGAGLGHLETLLPIAQRLRCQGVAVTFAVPNPAAAAPILTRDSSDFGLVEGVRWLPPTDPGARSVPTHSFADVIRLFNYHDEERLDQAVQRWRSVIEPLDPDVIVSDFSPTVALAAGEDWPRLAVGTGYAIPPAGRLLLPIRPWAARVPPLSRSHEAELVCMVNRIRHRHGGGAIDHFADLLSGHRTFVCTIPEFDPYRAYRTEPPQMPFNVPVVRPIVDRADADRQLVFLYLPANHSALPAVLGRLNLPCQGYIGGADAAVIARRAPRNLGLHRKPADLAGMLPRCRAVIHHAGLGTTYACLCAGAPQLLLPMNLEHAITARAVMSFGAAVVLPDSMFSSVDDIVDQIRQLLSSTAMESAAAATAETLSRRGQGDTLGAISSGISSLIAGSQRQST